MTTEWPAWATLRSTQVRDRLPPKQRGPWLERQHCGSSIPGHDETIHKAEPPYFYYCPEHIAVARTTRPQETPSTFRDQGFCKSCGEPAELRPEKKQNRVAAAFAERTNSTIARVRTKEYCTNCNPRHQPICQGETCRKADQQLKVLCPPDAVRAPGKWPTGTANCAAPKIARHYEHRNGRLKAARRLLRAQRASEERSNDAGKVLNVWATVTPRLKLSDEAALECRFLAHEDIPYMIFGELAQAEIEEQTETAVQRAVEKLEEITGARNFQTTMDVQKAAGSHSAYTCGERVRLNTNGKCRAGKMAQTDCEETVNASLARALYLNPDAGLVPVSGHYDTGTTVLIVPKAVRLVGQDGKVQNQPLPGRPRHNDQALSRYHNPARVRSISLLVEIRPLDYDGDAEQQWVDTDLLVRRYGDHAVAILSDQFKGDAETLTDLLVHMSKQYVNQKYTEPWEQRLKCAVSAHRALGNEDAAFQTELDTMARKLLREQRSRPNRDHFEAETAEGIFSWTRKPKEPEPTPENA